jgi:hypothetical protein
MTRAARCHVLLAGLLVGDAVFIAADILQRQQVLHDVRFLVTHDRGFGEWFQYCKAALGCLLLARTGSRRSSVAAFTWAALLAFVLLDDSLEIHEHAGEILASLFRLPSLGSLRGNQLGELIFYAFVGTGCLVALALAWWRADLEEQALSRTLFPWFAALGFCAVFLDAVSSLTRKTPWAIDLALLEDGGEMVVLSFLTAAVCKLFEQRHARPRVTTSP